MQSGGGVEGEREDEREEESREPHVESELMHGTMHRTMQECEYCFRIESSLVVAVAMLYHKAMTTAAFPTVTQEPKISQLSRR